MSESQLVTETESVDPQSPEDKFFGVKTTFEKKKKPVVDESSSSEYDIEIVDDRPPEDRRPPKAESKSESDDEELGDYSEKVQKRLNKVKFDYHEERRQPEAAERMREEAVKIAQQYATKNQEQESLISRGEAALIEQIKQKSRIAVDQAKADYKKAYEEGDTDGVANAQERMVKAQAESQEIERYSSNASQQAQQLQAQRQAAYQQQIARQAAQNVAAQQPVQPQLSPESQEWADKNTWFADPSKKAMTATAYGLHEEAITDMNLAPNSQEYFEYIDNGMRESYPNFDWGDNSDTDGRSASVTSSQPSTVVAPSARNNGAKPRKVRLTATQVALAKRLGITNEQYAQHLS